MSLQYDQNETAPCARNAECTGSAVALPGGPARVAETTTQPKLWPIRWNRTSRPLSLATRWRPARSVWKLVSPIVRARSFILKNDRFRRMPTTGPSSVPPTPKLTSLSSSTTSSYAASGSNGSRSLPGALAGPPAPRPASRSSTR